MKLSQYAKKVGISEGVSPENSEFSSASLSGTDIALITQNSSQVWAKTRLLVGTKRTDYYYEWSIVVTNSHSGEPFDGQSSQRNELS